MVIIFLQVIEAVVRKINSGQWLVLSKSKNSLLPA